MWADNETRLDLLGFDYLVDSLEVVLTEPRLLPVTVGVLGEWGSGKSSLLGMVADRMESSRDYVVVQFSPWRYEAYEDVKAALMDAVLTAIDARIGDADDPVEASGLMRELRRKVRRLMIGPAAAGRALIPAAGAALAMHHGAPPELGRAAGEALVAGVDAVRSDTTDTDPESEPAMESVADFRDEFATLVGGLTDVKATIVLIDDLDRCLDDTIIDVFEAIRLFLHVPATAFVIAANRDIVQAAVESRYPSRVAGDPSLGKDYLEKIVQVEINVPPLASTEAETYLNLLFVDLRLDPPAMAAIRSEAASRRRLSHFGVAMNYGIARDVLGTVPPELEDDFAIANQIAPTLSRGLRGNPRQLKRFMNTLLLRYATAKRRGVKLEPAVLAKLMVLEQQRAQFEQLFLWQLHQDGIPDELAVAEAAVGRGGEPTKATAELTTWLGTAGVRQWVVLDPQLAGIALGEYFFFSRDRLSPVTSGARLSAALQTMLSRLQLPVAAQRRSAVTEAATFGADDLSAVYEALLERARRQPAGSAMTSAVELAARSPGRWPSLVAILSEIPHTDIPPKLPVTLAATGGAGRAELIALFDQWADSKTRGLSAAVAEARKTR